MRVRSQETLSERADAELVASARIGDVAAFEELYRRHADAAWRTAHAVAGNIHDAADAVSEAFTKVFAGLPSGNLADGAQFRSYLLAATRNAAIDCIRRGGKVSPASEIRDREIHTGPTDVVVAEEDNRLVAQAFHDLPERWRSVLWLTEVEGVPAREVGERLGISPNGAAQLAVRARAALRERFLQAHLRADVGRDCRYTVDRLGAYVGGKLAPRDLAKVDQHLAACEPCRQRKDELDNVGGVLRRLALPLPLLLGPQVVAQFKNVSAAAAATAPASSAGFGWADVTAKLQKPLLAASSGVFALGVISATVMGRPNAPLTAAPPPPRLPVAAAAEPEVPPVPPSVRFSQVGFEFALPSGPADFSTEAAPAPVTPTAGLTVPAATAGSGSATDVTGGGGGGAGGGGTTAPEPIAEMALTAVLGPIGAGLSLGAGPGSCVGGEVYPVGDLGCAPQEPATVDDGKNDIAVAVETDGTSAGPLADKSVTVGLL